MRTGRLKLYSYMAGCAPGGLLNVAAGPNPEDPKSSQTLRGRARLLRNCVPPKPSIAELHGTTLGVTAFFTNRFKYLPLQPEFPHAYCSRMQFYHNPAIPRSAFRIARSLRISFFSGFQIKNVNSNPATKENKGQKKNSHPIQSLIEPPSNRQQSPIEPKKNLPLDPRRWICQNLVTGE